MTTNHIDPTPDEFADVATAWQTAWELSTHAMRLPPFLVSVVRFLQADSQKGPPGGISPVTKYCLRRLMRSRSIASTLFHAGRTFYPERLDPTRPFSGRALYACFSPNEIAAIMAILLLYRKLSGNRPEAAREEFSKAIHLSAEIGGYVGRALPSVGLTGGLLVGAVRPMGHMLFQKLDPKGWNEYRRHTRSKGVSHDFEEERRLWGCNSLQLSTMLLQNAGLGVSIATCFSHALRSFDLDEIKISREVLGMRTSSVWIDQLMQTGTIPDLAHKVEYYPLELDLKSLLANVEAVRSGGSQHRFLDRNYLPKPELESSEEFALADAWPALDDDDADES